MASVQELSQINRDPLDTWSVSELLCLASAVPCAGDKNWSSVSHSLKMVCGNLKNSLPPRPADWFSQKNCDVQYDHLLEELETSKRKKRALEDTVSPTSATAEPPTDAILRKLTEDRMHEIKVDIRKHQEEYIKVYNEIKCIQSEEIDDEQLLQMWNALEKYQEMQRIEEMRLENRLRERELKKQEFHRSWRAGANSHGSTSSTNSLKSSTDTTAVDMDVEEIIGSSKTIIPACNNTVQTGTSPLLSSLLKSTTAGTTTTSVVSVPPVRNAAPTITILLTGGAIPNQNQPALIPSHDEAAQLLTRPISGPPIDTATSPVSVGQTLLSPSQSAPTLSMLLEKNKTCAQNTAEEKIDSSANADIVHNTTANDSNNESVPMDIEEDLASTKFESKTDITSGEIDDTDPNEEQQLLEVFKNIGNIEELDIDVSDVIDEEVDFLKGVDEEAPLDENIDIEQKLDVNVTCLAGDIKLLSNEVPTVNLNTPQAEISLTAQKSVDEDNLVGGCNKIEVISSDDSNDNIPLAAVASLESSKERLNVNESSNEETFLKDQVESANLKNDPDQVETANESADNSVAINRVIYENEKFSQDSSEPDNEPIKLTSNAKQKDDVFVAPTVEDITQENIFKAEKENINEEKQQQIKIEAREEEEGIDSPGFAETENNEPQTPETSGLDLQHDATETLAMPKIQPPPSISIADTDENSSSTDISVQIRKDEKHKSRGPRKSPNETKTDDEMPNPTTQQLATPNVSVVTGNLTPRPTALRKLRDRDRSESPMIDDDATTHSDHSTTNQRSRRRYSSTPVIDSIPNSPASSDRDERDLRTSKKSLLSIYNVFYSSKYSATVQRVLSDESSTQKLDEICLRSIDFITIKKNIESGLIRSVYELQRDILWMCQNALMVTKRSSASLKTILLFQQECQNIREFMINGCEPGHRFERETRDKLNISTSKGRSGSRKSLRLS